MSNAEAIQAKVLRLLPEGEALAHTDAGEYVRLRHAVPDDVVLLQVEHKRRGVTYARLLDVIEASPERVEAACPVANRCGGCALQYIRENAHAAIKSAWVTHAFQPAITPTTRCSAIEHEPLHEGSQRRRVRWQVRHEQGAVSLGFFAYQSHEIVTTAHCMVLTEALNALRQSLEERLSGCESLPESIYAVQLNDGIHAVLNYTKKVSVFLDLAGEVQGIPVQYWQRCGLSTKPLYRPALKLHDALPTASKALLHLNIGPDDFVQGQALGNHRMIQQVLAWCKNARFVVDFFAGAGNLSLPLAESGIRVLGAEVHAASVRAANHNAKSLNLSAHYQQADLFRSFELAPFVGADVLLLDPPRKGARAICRNLPQLMPRQVIMIHCDVQSAKVDAQEMLKQGYRLQALRALDLFPYSGHVESMSLWGHVDV